MNDFPELLSPAGSWDCARAAVANGANAIYFGLEKFNARLRANNFTTADLPELMGFLHRHGVRGFVTMNTLIFPDEIEEAALQLVNLENAGVDAVIIQDLGLAWIAKQVTPRLERHASTQMTVSSPEGLAFVNELLALDRVVLARELNLKELGKFPSQSADGQQVVPLEVFVHGALCVAYSGQCLTSESLGQRSANRGECAQACRMPYELIVDGQRHDLGERRYLLSPQDLAAAEMVGELIQLGVKSFKIEGRLKSPEYVAAVTKIYRKAIDEALETGHKRKSLEKNDLYAMEMVFSRGFSTGWLEAPNHPRLTHGRFGKKRGLFLGKITATGMGWVEILREMGPNSMPIKPGDGVVFDAGEDRNTEQGGRIWKSQLINNQRNAELFQSERLYFDQKFSRIDWRRVREGQFLWKTDDPELNTALKKSWKSAKLVPVKTPLKLVVSGKIGERLEIFAPNFGVRVFSEENLVVAQNQALSRETLELQLGRLGETEFLLGTLSVDIEGNMMLPLSSLNRMRRALIEEIVQKKIKTQLAENKQDTKKSLAEILSELGGENSESQARLKSPELRILCRKMQQIEPAIESGIRHLFLDFEDIRRYAEAVARVRELSAETLVFLATPQIQKPGEAGVFELIKRAEPDGVLVRNLGAVSFFKDSGLRKIGDFSLNVANPVTARLLKSSGRFENLTLSYDLNINQILDFLAAANPADFELTLHQNMPLFHMEHCVFCAFLSAGTSYLNCGRPCEKHVVQLRDRVGQSHRLLADVGCRNTLFNAKAQTGASFYKLLIQNGLRKFRVELLDEQPEATKRIINCYQSLLKEEISPQDIGRELSAISQLGVTEGTFFQKLSI